MATGTSTSKKKPSAGGTSKYYPPVGFHFRVRIVNTNDSSGLDSNFQEVSGISAEIPTEDFYEGGVNSFTYKLPKTMKYSPLQLKRGLVSSLSALGEWCKTTLINGFDQPIVTKDVVVSLLDEENEPLMSWKFIDAYPTKWSVSNFNAQNNDIVIESLELTYKRFEQVKV
ncbi:phage tail protein [Sporocytophaga myxococcoides]|uniref:phage tail protein n=1 Tax=Sporocytophaga myxococcoides TaxID=153721 RepID=UPI00040E4D45|nr:phage tail protein [Sporocytophaga myxococcoides]